MALFGTRLLERSRKVRRWPQGFPLLLLLLLLCVSPARAEEDDLQTLQLYNGSGLEMVSAGRSPRPASQTAENITVITAKDIEALNAHTLADVLFNVTGVELEYLRTPGSIVNINLQGASPNHILVLIDNVPYNNLANNFPDIASVPVQMIERVEIVKGAASSSWGNALGGIINVITKSPGSDPFAGLASLSYGKRATTDGRVETSGTVQRLGYYLTLGKLRSDGLLPNNNVDLRSFYGKLRYELPQKGSITVTSGYIENDSGQLQLQAPTPAGVLTINGDQQINHLIATLSAQYPLTDRLTLDGQVRTNQMRTELLMRNAADRSILRSSVDDEGSTGGVVRLSWLDDLQNLVLGVDYDHVHAHLPSAQIQADVQNPSDNRVGTYFNDTFTLGRFAITPSARFDHTETSGNLFSPSFGVTYALTDNTVLRGYTARGYSLTSLNRDNSTEKVWTSQVGFETSDIPYLWLKGTLFRNDTWNITLQTGPTTFSKVSQLRQGAEVEAHTLPLFGTSLLVGYTFDDARDEATDAVVRGLARHNLNLGLKYEDSRFFRGLLIGHFIDWNNDPGLNGGSHDIIWDLHLGKKIEIGEGRWLELFLSVRNLFNGTQYLDPRYLNPGRWTEGGIKCAF